MLPPMPMLHSTPSIALVRSANPPSLSLLPRGKKQDRDSTSSASPAVPGPSALSRTTLSQRFRRAIHQGDLVAAQRIAARAFELQSSDRLPSHDTHGDAGNNGSSWPTKASLRAAQAQRCSSEHPFDVRNVELVPDRIGVPKHHHHRKYTLAIHDEPASDHLSSADPSLVIAIRSNADVELVRWLIEMGHEHETPCVDADGNTVLHLATLYDRPDIIYAYSTYNSSYVASSLADLIDAEQAHERRTALHLACIRGFDDVARQLLDLGADVDLQDRAGNTALHFASAWGHLSLVQLLIERGCSLAVKNTEGSTASDYAYSHSVKEALETLGRVRYESRKKTRRVPVATVMPAPVRPSMSVHAGASQAADESFASEKQSRSRPLASFLSRNGSHGGGAQRGSTTTTPVRATFAEGSVDPPAELYDDWDPEKTFAQPGQDLLPGSKRGVISSPSTHHQQQHGDSSTSMSTPSRPSIDLYTEVLNQSPRGPANTAGTAPVISYDRTGSPQPRPARSSEDAISQWHAMNAQQEIKRSRSPNLRTPSPGVGSAADKVRMQDAAAMSLFRSVTPQPSHVPGRIDTPPVMGRSESPLLLSSRAGKSGVRSPPPPPPSKDERSADVSHRIGEGPPLLAPVATLARQATGVEQELFDEESGGEALTVGVEEARGRGMGEATGDARRDSSPSTPRPADDRESFP